MEKRKVLVILAVLPFFLFLSPSEEESHSPSILGYVGKVVNFLVLFGGLIFLLRKPLREFLEKKAEGIRTAMKEAEEERKETADRLSQTLTRLQELGKEMEEIRRQAEEDGRKRKESIINAAHEEAERIKHFACQEIDLYSKTKIRELRAMTAEWATSLAKARLEEKMTPERQNSLIDSSIDKLEDLYEKQNSH